MLFKKTNQWFYRVITQMFMINRVKKGFLVDIEKVRDLEYEHAIWKLYPDKFYTWREAMFKAQDAEGDTGFGNATTIDALITKLGGFDVAKIKADVAANKAKYDADIQANTQEGQKFGIQGTPGFIVGTKSIDGAQEIAAFKAAIDAQLK